MPHAQIGHVWFWNICFLLKWSMKIVDFVALWACFKQKKKNTKAILSFGHSFVGLLNFLMQKLKCGYSRVTYYFLMFIAIQQSAPYRISLFPPAGFPGIRNSINPPLAKTSLVLRFGHQFKRHARCLLQAKQKAAPSLTGRFYKRRGWQFILKISKSCAAPNFLWRLCKTESERLVIYGACTRQGRINIKAASAATAADVIRNCTLARAWQEKGQLVFSLLLWWWVLAPRAAWEQRRVSGIRKWPTSSFFSNLLYRHNH